MAQTADAATQRQTFLTGLAFALLAVVLWSGNFIVARALHQKITPVSLAFYRWSIATLVLLPLVIKRFRSEWSTIRKHGLYLSATAITGITLFNTFIYIAGRYSPAMNLALIGTTASPVFVLVISGFFLGHKVYISQAVGALLCIIGILFLIGKGNLAHISQFRFSAGDLWVLSAALLFAVYTILVRRKPGTLSPPSFLFAVFALGTLFLLPAFLVDKITSPVIDWNVNLILILIYLGLGASVIAFYVWNLSINRIGPARTALFGNLIPVFSSLEATVLLHEPLTWVTLVSFLLILSGLTIANLQALKRK